MHGKIKKVFFRVIHYAIMVMITVLMLMPIGWMLEICVEQPFYNFSCGGIYGVVYQYGSLCFCTN